MTARLAFSFLVLTCIATNAWARPEIRWEYMYTKSGLNMYEAIGTSLPTYKAEGIIPVNLLDLLAVISDVPRRPEWLPDIDESRILEGDIESRVIIYERFDMPWPVTDRDCVVESVIYKDFAHGVVTVTFKEIEHPAKPPVEGLVRIPIMRGQMQFSYLDSDRTVATYEATLDIDTSLPDWLFQIALRRLPIFTLEAITQQVKRTRGQYNAFVAQQQEKLKFEYARPSR